MMTKHCTDSPIFECSPRSTDSVRVPMYLDEDFPSVLLTNYVKSTAFSGSITQLRMLCTSICRRVTSAFMPGMKCYSCVCLRRLLLDRVEKAYVSNYTQVFNPTDVVDV